MSKRPTRKRPAPRSTAKSRRHRATPAGGRPVKGAALRTFQKAVLPEIQQGVAALAAQGKQLDPGFVKTLAKYGIVVPDVGAPYVARAVHVMGDERAKRRSQRAS